MGDFVKPEPHRISISGNHFIDIKKRLNVGEREDMFGRFVEPGDLTRMNRRDVRTSKLLAFLLGWSLTDDEGVPVPMSPALPEADRLDTIRSLDPDRFDEIMEAIEKHEDAMAKKKVNPAGENVSPATSPSPAAVTGAMSGSVN